MTDYNTFYGFSEDPFKDSPNPKFFFPAEGYNEALLSLQYGINERKGFILLLGEQGIGKTTLINYLRSTLDAKVKIAFIPRSNIPYKKILKEILHQLDVPLKLNVKGSMLHELYYHLIKHQEHDENVAIILDEAHDIDDTVVEEVRLMANLETSTAKLVQIVLCGEPELRDKLRADVIRQIGQRIVITSRIEPMSQEESSRYIDHRLKIVGSTSAEVFTDESVAMICKEARGVPRDINILCSNALFVARNLGEKKVSAASVRKIRKEKVIMKGRTLQMRPSRIQNLSSRKILAAVAVFLALGMFTFFGKDLLRSVLNRYAAHNAARQAVTTLGTPAPAAKLVEPPHEKTQPAVSTPMIITDTEIRVKTVVEATRGTSLSLLALKHYNMTNITLLDYMLDLNSSIKNPNLILVNQKIRLPEITDGLWIKQTPVGAFKVHLKTFADRSAATQYSSNLTFTGKEIEIVPRQVSARESWYRVIVGPYAGRSEAIKAVSDMKQRGLFDVFPSRPMKSSDHL